MNPGKLAVRLLLSTIAAVVGYATLLFVPAGTIYYWQAWVYLVGVIVATITLMIYFAVKDPELLERRLKGGPTQEPRPVQRVLMSVFMLIMFAVFVVSGLDHRFKWSHMSPIVSVVGALLVALGYFINFLALRVNSYGAATIQVFEAQTVISTGPYRIVRHPMYVGDLIMVIGMPLALGSWWGLLSVVVLTPALIWRILDEEALLRSDLPGYSEYMQHVRYRLVPFVW
jgi:protein-S-isoprenylcysteine O-methyltransferase Ste14